MAVEEIMMRKKSGNLKKLQINGNQNNLEIIKKRLSGWQLESFNESYEYKINNGVSLFKKNLKNDKSTIVIIIYIIGLNFWSFSFRYVEC